MAIAGNLYHYLLATSILAALLVLVTLLQYYKNTTLKCQVKFLTQDNGELRAEQQHLRLAHITDIEKIAKLSAEVANAKQLLVQQDTSRAESFDSAKAALFDLGGQLAKQLIEIHKNETKDARELSAQNIAVVGNKFNSEFERLINLIGALSKDIAKSRDTVDIIKQSLLSPSGAGKLAEITLENILKSSGLKSKLDYVMQYTITAAVENGKLRPDALIFLPAGNLMVIDAKASKFLLEDLKSGSLVKTMNGHLKSLSAREYAENILLHLQNKETNFNNIITLMFLPTEHAVEKIIDLNPSFLEQAWATNIFPVGPAGLMNMLSFAKFQISEYQQIKNHKLIIAEVKQLLQSIKIIAEHSQKMGANLQSMVSNYDKFAASFNRNFLNKAKNIEKLGISGNKSMVANLERFELITSKAELITVAAQETILSS